MEAEKHKLADKERKEKEEAEQLRLEEKAKNWKPHTRPNRFD